MNVKSINLNEAKEELLHVLRKTIQDNRSLRNDLLSTKQKIFGGMMRKSKLSKIDLIMKELSKRLFKDWDL